MSKSKDIYDAILDAPVIQFGESTYVSVKDLMNIIIDFEDAHRGKWTVSSKGLMSCSVCNKTTSYLLTSNVNKDAILESYTFCRCCGSKMVDVELLDDRPIIRHG